ncbi:MAG: tRNA uridine(34) 5-carboxymethylaminomethyl modification radical SAM/GNAT enzyme Elp3 [Patescibacteria group bacterium]|jgi:elongator complex protein 3
MREIILKIVKNKPKSIEELSKLKRVLAKKYNISVLRHSDILKGYRSLVAENLIKKDEKFEDLLRKRAVRTLSGVAPVAVLTKPFACPGKCAYCPHEKDVPTSYLSNEPAVMRAIRNKYSPFKQVWSRLESLDATGHRPEKIELIVIGGTWSVLPRAYKYWFIKECFRAANNYKLSIINYKSAGKPRGNIFEIEKELLLEQKKNEKAKYKIIGLTLETRPDYINEKELIEMRDLGATRVELGVQAVDDKILEKNKRGHGVDKISEATALLRAFGFKVTYHLMPGLPGATAKKDLELFKKIFTDPRFQPDQIKFYPTVVTRGSLLYKWWKAGLYKPYSGKVLENLIIECKKVIPPYVRVLRLIRDIPGESIVAGNLITNLRQVMQQKGAVCGCIRCRECREKKISEKNIKINILKYEASGGMEYFISADSLDGKTLYGFCRLRLPELSINDGKFKFLNSSAIVRELHVYGELVPTGGKKKTQHFGLGQRLLKQAEKISKENNFKNIAVISGIGARGYYKKFGYKMKSGYLVKGLKK